MKQSIVDIMNEMIKTELSEKQRRAIKSVMIHGVPLNKIAEDMGTTRNAVYKLIHDARKKLKTKMEEKEITEEDIHEIFS